MEDRTGTASSLVRAILQWHQEVGLRRIQSEHPSFAGDYIGALEHFKSLDLADRRNIFRVASQQLDGILTVFSSERILIHVGEPPEAETLAAVARRILDLLEGSADPITDTPPPFDLPPDWFDHPQDLPRGRVQVPLGHDETPEQAYRRYFGKLADQEERGIGGCELLISMNEDAHALEVSERPPVANAEDVVGDRAFRSVTAYYPGSFDFHLATRPEDLASRVIRDEVQVVAVVFEGRSLERSEVEQHEN